MTYLIRTQLSGVDDWLANLEDPASVELGRGISIDAATFFISILVAVTTRVLKFHDLISKTLGIRRRFDTRHILLPLAAGAGAILNADQKKRVSRDRNRLMTRCFYRYAVAGQPDKSVVSQHDITMAIDQWSWYWVILESGTVLSAATATLLIGGAHSLVPATALVAAVFFLLLPVLQRGCERYAGNEVDQILQSEERKRQVRDEFSAL